MPGATLEALLLKAHQEGVECSLDDLRRYDEFAGLGLMTAIEAIDEKLESVGLSIHPSVQEGEVDQKRIIARRQTKEKFELELEEAISSGEGQEAEYKETLYLKKRLLNNNNIPKEHWVSEDMIFECVKTICAFLNADGGTLLIGVDDDGNIQGIECELEFVKGGDGSNDKWELFFSNCLQKYIYDFSSCIGYISRKIIQVEEKSICVVLVRSRRTAITVCRSPSDNTAEIVFLRNGNGSKEIKARAIEELIRSRLPAVTV